MVITQGQLGLTISFRADGEKREFEFEKGKKRMSVPEALGQVDAVRHMKKLEAQAAKKYQEEYKKLDDVLKEARRKIQELQGQKSADQKFIMSADQITELKKLRDQEFETQKKLKEVRKDLRRDVEREGMKHKVVNIAGIPLLAALFGIVYGVRRRSRSSK